MKDFKFLSKNTKHYLFTDGPIPENSTIISIGDVLYNPLNFDMVKTVQYTTPNGDNRFSLITQDHPLWNWPD